ncbi:MAG: hypothetical protein KC535_04870 [Nanoarchaeota archaeon]|nr:hypothetical protein [Nanoarchaeota archaeon]
MVLNKIKNMLSHDEVIEALENKVKESLEKVNALTSTIDQWQEEQKKLSELTTHLLKDQQKLTKQVQKSQEQIEIAQEKLNRAVSEILIFKPKLEKDLAGKFEQTLQKQLDEATKDLNVDVDEHKKAQDILSRTQESQKQLLKEITSLQDIAKHLKAEDFALSKHAKELHLKDQEKLRLLKRVDDLEKLLAKMKRK